MRHDKLKTDCVLFDRMTKVAQDPFATFQLTWGAIEKQEPSDVFGVAIVGHGHTVAFEGPRKDWQRILTKALDYWDDIKVGVVNGSGRLCRGLR